MSKYLKEKYASLAPYVPGEQPRDMKYIKLNTNESPFPPSPLAIQYAKEEAERLMLYPDPELTLIKGALADYYGVKRECVSATNGSDDALNFAFMAFCDDSTPALFADITYGFYKVFARLNHIPYTEIPLLEDFTLSVDDYIGRRGTVFIANPNAPTGIFLPLSEIERLVASDTSRVVIIDEAYVDFGGESAVRLTEKYPNLLVIGTFSKSRSLAGGRLGFAIGSQELISDIERIRNSTNPYNINRMTMAAGVGALADRAYFEDNCKKIIRTRENTSAQLRDMGFTLTPSSANFIFASHRSIDAEQMYLTLKKNGILVRHFTQERIKDYNRITVGNAEEMQILIDKIKELWGDIL
ncbi:MAG: histidinol-phosphate transaminase [Clostridia bacterium]|nr:histidinol-phosphate transaminase [Clostridia bacterium]